MPGMSSNAEWVAARARRERWDVIANLRSLGKTIFLTTHYMDEAQALADRVAVIAAGEIVAEGTPEQVVKSRRSYTARALGFSIFTEAKTLEALHASVRDAVHCHFDEAERPQVIRLHFVRDQLIAV